MKYLTRKESKKTVFEGKEVELVSYVPENHTEALYYLQPPEPKTYEDKIKQLIIAIFLRIDAEQNKRLNYHFSTHEFLKVQGIDQEMKAEILRKLRETLSYFPEDKVKKHLKPIKKYIETFTPVGLTPQPKTPEEVNRTTREIESKIDSIHYNGWKYVFRNVNDYKQFINLFTLHFEDKEYSLPEKSIPLQKNCKTRLAKVLKELQKDLDLKEQPLKHDEKYFELVKKLSPFENESDLYKVISR